MSNKRKNENLPNSESSSSLLISSKYAPLNTSPLTFTGQNSFAPLRNSMPLSRNATQHIFTIDSTYLPHQFYQHYLHQTNCNFTIKLANHDSLQCHSQILHLNAPTIFTSKLLTQKNASLNLASVLPCHLERYRGIFKNFIIPLCYGVRDLVISDLVPVLHILHALGMQSHVDLIMGHAQLRKRTHIMQCLRDVLPETQQMETPEHLRQWVLEHVVRYMHKLNAAELAHLIADENLLIYILSHEESTASQRLMADIVLEWMRHHEDAVTPQIYEAFIKYIANVPWWNTLQEALFMAHLANKMRDDDMMNNVALYLARRMHHIERQEALDLPYDVFFKIITLDDVSLDSENAIYSLLAGFLTHNEELLLPEHNDALLRSIRSMYLTDEYHELFFNDPHLSKRVMQEHIIAQTRLRQGRLLPSQIPSSRNCLQFVFRHQSDGDHNGLLYYFGLDANRDPDKKWQNPMTVRKLVNVYRNAHGAKSESSNLIETHPPCSPPLAAILRRPEHYPQKHIYCKIKEILPNDEIFTLQLTSHFSVKPTAYSICFENADKNVSKSSLRNKQESDLEGDTSAHVSGGWILEGAEHDPQEGGEWVTLRGHTGLGADFRGWKTWSLPQNKSVASDCFFRFFRLRILQRKRICDESAEWNDLADDVPASTAESQDDDESKYSEEIVRQHSGMNTSGMSPTLVGSFCLSGFEVYGELKYRCGLAVRP